MTRLLELEPRFICGSNGRFGMGLSFLCPCCGDIRIRVFFANPMDGLPPDPVAVHHHRDGETFDTLTLSPEINCAGEGHWHGQVIHGGIE